MHGDAEGNIIDFGLRRARNRETFLPILRGIVLW